MNEKMIGLRLESSSDKRVREKQEKELQIQADKKKAEKLEQIERDKEGLELNRKALKQANISIAISVIAAIIALLSFLKMFF